MWALKLRTSVLPSRPRLIRYSAFPFSSKIFLKVSRWTAPASLVISSKSSITLSRFISDIFSSIFVDCSVDHQQNIDSITKHGEWMHLWHRASYTKCRHYFLLDCIEMGASSVKTKKAGKVDFCGLLSTKGHLRIVCVSLFLFLSRQAQIPYTPQLPRT